MQTFTIAQDNRPHKGDDFLKIHESIKRIQNYMQIEPTRNLIDLFAKRTGDLQLKQELTHQLLEKARRYDCE